MTQHTPEHNHLTDTNGSTSGSPVLVSSFNHSAELLVPSEQLALSPIHDIARKMTGEEFPLQQGANYIPKIRETDDASNLPEPVQAIIQEIRFAESIQEKAAIAHSFSLSYIQAETQYGGVLGSERKVSFQELAEDPRGDCDDYANFSMGLMIHGGVDPNKIFDVSAMVRYSMLGKNIEMGHALLIVEDNGQHFMLDNNLNDIAQIDIENPRVTGTIPNQPSLPQKVEIEAEIGLIAGIVDGSGTPYENEAAFEEMVSRSQSYIDMLREQATPESHAANTVQATDAPIQTGATL
ncbi:hypothetical protein AB835_09815 [Candidatus Endobugula sertula]|uniref:Transglutaminase-like domain-containing protein n=1 Tax=Candidatus Endobugula sertula TaxID=62101 RepID=A0A1D2QNW7_9GAMM|nr:hypothetical protein AB835_09815 [Candidatus Endobugula sertula]